MKDQTSIIALLLALGIAVISFILFTGTIAAICCLLGWTMLAITIFDVRYLIIPDMLSLPAIPAGLLLSGYFLGNQDPSRIILEHIIAMCAGAAGVFIIRAIYRARRGREGIGLGDVKLVAVAGAWTGMAGLSHVILLACLTAIIYVLTRHFSGQSQISATSVIPFGAFLAPSIWLVWTFGRYLEISATQL